MSDRSLVAEVARLRREVEQIKRGQRIAHGASIENAAVEVRDDAGSLRAIVGQQADGTTAANIVNGPPPPAPSTPGVAPDLGGVAVTWDGQFAGGEAVPLDFSRVEVHTSAASGFTPDLMSLKTTIESPQGGTVRIPTDTPVYVVLLARNTSGTPSTASTQVGPEGPAPVVANDVLDGIITETKLAADAVTQAKIATGAVGTTEIADNAVTTPKLVAGAVQADQIAAGAVATDKLAAQAVTTVKLAASAVTANELAANSVTAGKIAAGSVTATSLTVGVRQSIATKLTDAMGDATLWNSVSSTGTASWLTGVSDAVAGGTVLQASGPLNMERVDNIPFDPTALYKVMFRVRTVTAPSSGSAVVYLGVEGIAADGTTRVNNTGANSIGNQHYVAAANVTVAAGTGWTTFTGYIQGTAATGTTTACPDPKAPGQVYSSVRYIRPLLRLLYGATDGVMQADQVTVETVPTGVVNTVNIAGGAVTANEIAAGAVTTAKLAAGAVTANEIAANTITASNLAAGSVDATALKADAITGKTISGGTITGATITGGTLNTNGSGTNVKILTSSSGAGVIQFPSSSPVEGESGSILSTRGNSGAANEYLLLNINSPKCAAPADGQVQIQLNSQNADGTSNANIGFFNYSGGTQAALMTLDKSIFRSYINMEVRRPSSGDQVYNALVSGDTSYRFIVRASGQLTWGTGASNLDTTLYRSGANALTTDGDLTTKGGLFVNRSSVTNALSVFVSGDAYYRLLVNANGDIRWGSGSANQDTNLYRGGAGVLATDGVFRAASEVMGQVSITPAGDGVVTSTQVTGLNVAGTSFYGFVTASTSVPGDRKPAGAAGVTGVSCTGESSTGLTIYVNRQNTTLTYINWLLKGR